MCHCFRHASDCRRKYESVCPGYLLFCGFVPVPKGHNIEFPDSVLYSDEKKNGQTFLCVCVCLVEDLIDKLHKERERKKKGLSEGIR